MPPEVASTIDDNAFKHDLVALIPQLRAFARSLTQNATAADDLAQDAMMRAWAARASFVPGTNIRAWCFRILRNHFYSDKRRAWRSQPLAPEVAEAVLVSPGAPSDSLELLAVRNALGLLATDQREALMLISAGGLSYDEAAEICNCAVGTIKSRVARARKALTHILESNQRGYSSDPDASAADAFAALVDEGESATRAS